MTVFTTNFGELLEPVLREVFGLEYGRYTNQYTRVFETRQSTKKTESTLSVAGFPMFNEKPEGSSVDYEGPKQGFKGQWTNVTYALGFKVSAEMYTDDQYGVMNQLPAALARSGYYTREYNGADILNSAFDSTVRTGADGLELCSTAHLLEKGGTYRNELAVAADLDATSMEQALIDISDLVDGDNLLIAAMPKRLIVPAELKWTGKKLLMSSQDPESANNAINPAKDENLELVTYNFLTDPDAWFIQTDVPNGLVYYENWPMDFTRDNDEDTLNAKYKGVCRYVFGWDNPRGIFGSPGA